MPRRAGYKTRTKAERALQALEAVRLHLKKWSYIEIGEEQGRSYESVRQDIVAARNEWRKQNATLVQDTLEDALRTLEILEREVWEAWEKSKKRADKRRKETLPKNLARDFPGANLKESHETKFQCGDPRFAKILSDIQRNKAAIVTAMKLTGPVDPVLLKVAQAMGVVPKDDAT